MHQLRNYQSEWLDKIIRSLEENKSVLGQLPTGAGKTICFAHLCEKFSKVLILVHRKELLHQARSKVLAVTGLEPGMISPDSKIDLSSSIQIASVQTLSRRPNLKLKPDLIVVDEAHHTPSKTYRSVLKRYPKAKVLGVTATPCRLDGKGLDDLYEKLVTGPTIQDLILAGYLSKFECYIYPKKMNVKGVRSFAGDYSVSDLAKKNNSVELAGNLISSYEKYIKDGRCIVFAVNVEHARNIAERYKKCGIAAECIDSMTLASERDEAVKNFSEGKIKVLVNCQIFTEGFDVPDLDAVQIARPTKSLALWLQMAGRALRPSKNKDKAIILDHTNNWDIHGSPSQPRFWCLEGISPKKERKSRSFSKIPVNRERDVIECNVDLQKLELTNLEEWQYAIDMLKDQVVERNVHPSVIYYQFVDAVPPFAAWLKFAEMTSRNDAWAKKEFVRQCKRIGIDPETVLWEETFGNQVAS